jgi:hypothetical protein
MGKAQSGLLGLPRAQTVWRNARQPNYGRAAHRINFLQCIAKGAESASAARFIPAGAGTAKVGPHDDDRSEARDRDFIRREAENKIHAVKAETSKLRRLS